jgi:predicted kinase
VTGVLTCLAGAASAGKSHLARERWLPAEVFARDWARTTVGAAANDVSPGVVGDADDLLEMIVGMRLHRGAPVVVDSTGTAEDFLERMLQAARANGARCELVIVDTPLSLCITRNYRRTPLRQVPEPEIERQHAAVTAMVARYATGPAPWDHVEVVSGAGPAAGPGASTIGTGARTTRCKWCTVECFWAVFATTLQATKPGDQPPLNLVEATPRDDGDLVVVRWSGGAAVVRALDPDEVARGEVAESRFRRHRAFCKPTAGGAR